MTATVTSFPHLKHTGGGDTAPTFSGWSDCLQFIWEVGLPPLWFSSHHHFYKLSQSWLLGVFRRSCFLLPACLFTVPLGISPPPLFSIQCLLFFLLCVFLLLLLIIQFFFPWVVVSLSRGSVCPGGYADLAQGCLWEYCVLLSSPCGLCLLQQTGCWHLAAQEPSWFLHLT
jgi:hypothetical protein